MTYEEAAAKWNRYAQKQRYTGCPVSVEQGASGSYLRQYSDQQRVRFAISDTRAAANGAEDLGWTQVAAALRAGADEMAKDSEEVG